MPIEQETQWKTEEQGKNKRRNIACHADPTEMYDLFFKNEIITNEEQDEVKKGVATATGSVTERLQRYHPMKNRKIKKVDKLNDESLGTFEHVWPTKGTNLIK